MSCRHVSARMAVIALALPALAATAALAGPAINQFEIKDLDSAPGEMQFQSQNAIAFGQPGRKSALVGPGQYAFDDNSVTRERYALEMQMGITSWFRTRIGIEFEKERLEDPGSLARANAFEDLHLTGFAVEGVFVAVPLRKDGFGLGLLVEYDHAVRGGDNQLFIGPIVQASSGPFTATANILLVQHMGADVRNGFEPDRKRDFAYAAQLLYAASPAWAVALEAYGTVDRIGGGTPPATHALFGDFDQHRLGPVVYYRFGGASGAAKPGSALAVKGKAGLDDDDGPGKVGMKGKAKDDDDKENPISVGVGVLFGLNGNTPSETLKLSLEVNF